MQTTSQIWQNLWQSGNAWLETVAIIDGTEYTEISNPVITRASTQDGLSIGNAVSATCEFSIRTNDTIQRSAKVVIKTRLSDGTATSEWINKGTFYISKRTKDLVTGVTSLECYDALLKANAEAVFFEESKWVTENGDVIVTDGGDAIIFTSVTFPVSMYSMAQYIAVAIGVEIDPRTSIATGSAYMIEEPETGTALRDLLGSIGSANGGNWIITPDNKLRLLPIAPDTSTVDSVTAEGVLESIDTTPTYPITGIRYQEEDKEYIIGDSSGIVIDANVSADIANDLARELINKNHLSYRMNGAIYNPAAEQGDLVYRLNSAIGFLENQRETLGISYRGDISAAEPSELADEYPYIGANQKTFKSLRAAISTKASIEYVNNSLVQAIADATDLITGADGGYVRFIYDANNKLTEIVIMDTDDINTATKVWRWNSGGLGYSSNGYAGPYTLAMTQNGAIVADFITSGILNANVIRAGMIADSSGENYWRLDGNNSEFVTNKGIIGNFTLDNGDLQYGSQAVGGTGAYIGKDGISYNETYNDDPEWPNNLIKTSIFPQGIRFYWDNTLRTQLYIYNGGLHVRCYDENATITYPIRIFDRNNVQTIHFDYMVFAWENFYIYGEVSIRNNTEVRGDFSVTGTKNRRVQSDDYGERLLYSYETPSPMFGDVGEGVIGEDGRCYVWLDPIFAQTIATDRYQVFLQQYGSGECWVAERRAACFIVEGAPGLAFGWEIKAKQKDFDQRRLDAPIETPERTNADFAAMAQAHIDQIHEGRVSA